MLIPASDMTAAGRLSTDARLSAPTNQKMLVPICVKMSSGSFSSGEAPKGQTVSGVSPLIGVGGRSLTYRSSEPWFVVACTVSL